MSQDYRLVESLRKARGLVDLGMTPSVAVASGLIPPDLAKIVLDALEAEASFELLPVPVISAQPTDRSWLEGIDRKGWYHWPVLRQHLLSKKGWTISAVNSIDSISERVLAEICDPHGSPFDRRGLVLGYVQSGKTASYTALIAKAVDAGYRLVIVLSGMDNALRRQTNTRLRKELVGSSSDPSSVRLPPHGKQWHEFTSDEWDGDFRPGHANHAALQGPQPVLMVVKKNVRTLRRLLEWLSSAPPEILAEIPVLVIDDEADQASVDTRGSYSNDPDGGSEEPAVINGLIRGLLNKFMKKAYVAYTATPFANVFIPHDNCDSVHGNDLYPRDFIIPLPRPEGYMGTEELFGRSDDPSGAPEFDPVNEVPQSDADRVLSNLPAPSLESAVVDFALTGAARAARGQDHLPSTMLVHASRRKDDHREIFTLILRMLTDLRDEWRYMPDMRLRRLLEARWEESFMESSLASGHPWRFSDIEPHLGRFMDAVQVKTINSETGEVLNYEEEPSLKAIAVGGNRLSRGLTLEGLTVSYFVRRSPTYDTLLQMGRWFGFRPGYADLVRIWTTREIAAAFSDLAFVEEQLRQDIGVYAETGLTPADVGMRVMQHPAMQPTNRPKRRHARSVELGAGFDGTLHQTYKFPLDDPAALAELCDTNLAAVRKLIASLPANPSVLPEGPTWTGVAPSLVVDFLSSLATDPSDDPLRLPALLSHMRGRIDKGSISRATVSVRGRKTHDSVMGTADWGANCQPNQIGRTRRKRTQSLGVITNPDDELAGLPEELKAEARKMVAEGRASTLNNAARRIRDSSEVALMLYPISRHSGYSLGTGSARAPLYSDPLDPRARDLVGVAISFPSPTGAPQAVRYTVGTLDWKEEE